MLLLTTLLALAGPAAQAAGQAQKTPPVDKVAWVQEGLDAALRTSSEKKTLTVVYFWAPGSNFCAQLYADTLCQDATANALAPLSCVSADVTSADGAALLAKFGVTTLPTLLFLTPEGEPEDAVLGLIGVNSLISEIGRIQSGQGTVGTLRAQSAAAPDDMALRLRLANKVADVGRAKERDEIIASIKRDDPKGETDVCARLLLADARDEVRAAASDPTDLRTWKLAPLEKHVKKIRPKQVAFEGWNLLANIERQRGDMRAAIDAWSEGRDFAPQQQVPEWGLEIVASALEARDTLRGKDKRFVVGVAQQVVDLVREQEAPPENPPSDRPGAPPDEEEEEGVDLATALEMLARAQHLAGKRAKAIAAIDEAIAIAPDRGQYRDRKAELERR